MAYLVWADKLANDRKWLQNRREKWFKENGPCKNCGSWENLELDHIDPAQKVSHKIWSWSDKRRLEELAKCQVLCYDCHKEKTRKDWANKVRTRKEVHGTRSNYNRGCRCSPCKDANSTYYKEYVKKNPRSW